MIEVWDEIASMQRRMDDVVREFLGPRARVSHPGSPLLLRRPFLPATDVFARDDDIVVRLEIPGIDPEKDLFVTLEKGQLVIRGERKRTEEVQDEEYYRMEAVYGQFERRLPMPEGIDEKTIVAEYSDGVLEVVVPKAVKALEAPKAKTIPVKSAKVLKAKAA